MSLTRRILAWSVHALTASGAFIGVLTLVAIYHHDLLAALWLMTTAILIDAVDGMFARKVQVRAAVPQIDGALLDNIVDFVNYTIVPCFFLLATPMLPGSMALWVIMAVTLASAYQFTQVDAKTKDHFFKGFPSYWNIAVFYLFFWQLSATANAIILVTLALLSFIPIKYVYPSRVDYLSENRWVRIGMVVLTCCWGVSTTGLLWLYPATNGLLVSVSLGYLLIYFAMSLYRTFIPLTLTMALVEE